MNRGDMREKVRVLVDDQRARRFTHPVVNRFLNTAAQWCGREIGKSQTTMNYMRRSVAVTTDGTNTTFSLDITKADFSRGYSAVYTAPNASTGGKPCVYYDRRDTYKYRSGNGFDDQGKLLYTIVYWADGDKTDIYRMEFPVVLQSGYVITLAYLKRVTALDPDGNSGTGSDFQDFEEIPEEFHDLVCYRTALELLGADDANGSNVAALYASAYEEMADFLSRSPEPVGTYDPDTELPEQFVHGHER